MMRFSQHFLDWLAALAQQRVVSQPQKHPEQITRLEQEYTNLRTALLWRLEHQPGEELIYPLHALVLFLDMRGRRQEMRDLCQQALAALQAPPFPGCRRSAWRCMVWR